MKRLRFFRCQTHFGGIFEGKNPIATPVSCGYEGLPEKALKPRPSTKPVLICPSCFSEVR